MIGKLGVPFGVTSPHKLTHVCCECHVSYMISNSKQSVVPAGGQA
jgi:hypothetical protein